jgi:hypothetical protein
MLTSSEDTWAESTWAESYTKLLAFNQTQYSRVLNLDSDSTVLAPMDELFLIPSAPVAMPRAYWMKDPSFLSSQLVLIEPSTHEFARIQKAIDSAGGGDFDMEIVNKLYGASSWVIPHRPYSLLTGEFRSENHTMYLGNPEERWDPEKVLKEAKFLHFSDWPVPKPWLEGEKVREEMKPNCTMGMTTRDKTDCRTRDLWLGFYDDFKKMRKQVCDIDV